MIPQPSQADDLYYAIQRRSMINRHICANGRFLQDLWLVKSTDDAPVDARWRSARRHSIEALADESNAEIYAYPLVLNDTPPDEDAVRPLVHGGGDNPFLTGGMAMAALAMEVLTDLSGQKTFTVAYRLFQFILDSEASDGDGRKSGLLIRRAHWWAKPTLVPVDEYNGVMVGLHFLLKAARKLGKEEETSQMVAYLQRLGATLKREQYVSPIPNLPQLEGMSPKELNEELFGGRGLFLYQFTYSRVFKFLGAGTESGPSFLFGDAIPDTVRGDSWAEAFGRYVLFGELPELDYRPSEFLRDVIRAWPPASLAPYVGPGDLLLSKWLLHLPVLIRVVANAVGVARAGEIDSFNKFMMPLNLLLLIDNPVNDDQKKEFWDQCKNWFPLLVGEGALMNPVFGSVWDRFAREQGDSDGIAVREGMQRSVLEPSKFFFHDLPLRALDADSVGQSSSVDPFAATSLALTRGLDEEPATRTLWGRNITWDRNWDIDDADIERLGGIDRSRSVTDQILELWPELSKVNRSDYSDRRSFGEMLREIGPDREAEDFRRRKISRDLFPVSDPTEETFWLENSGVDYVFARMLAGYLNRDYLPTLPPEEQENLDGLPLSGAGAGEYVDAINASLSDQVRRNRIGAASFLPGDDGRQEIVAPAEDGKLVHMSRRTELRFKPWRRSVFGPDQRYDNVCLVYAEDRGSLECFARNGDELHYFFQDESDWTAGGVLTSDTRGMPGGVYQPTGTIDLVVPREGSGLIHLRGALGEEASRSWEVVSTFARDRRGIDAVSVIQSVFGNLELVYRDGDKLRHMYRSLEGDWRGGNIDITDDARGAPSLLQGREGERGDFELLCPHQNRGLLYLRRNNDVPGQPWSSEGVWLRGRGQLDGVSMFRRSDGLLGATVFKDRDMFNIYKHPTLGWVEVLEFDGVDGVFVQALVTTDIAPPPGSPVDEYIALSNPSAEEELDLSGWSIRDAKGHRYTIGAYVLKPGETVRLWTRSGEDGEGNLYWGRRKAVWNNTGDLLVVENRDGAVVVRRRV